MQKKITNYLKVSFYIVIFLPFLNGCDPIIPPKPLDGFNLTSVAYGSLVVQASDFKSTQGDISISPEIKLTFSSNLDKTSLNNNIRLISKSSDEEIAIQFKTIANSETEILVQLGTNVVNLDRGGQYELIISKNVKSSDGANLNEEITLSFNTIRKSQDASLKVSYNRRNITAVNDVFTVRTSNVEEAQNVRLTFTVSDNAKIVEDESSDTVLVKNNILIKSFQFTDGETKKIAIISEDDSNVKEYEIRARIGAELTDNDILKIRIKIGEKEYNGTINGTNITFDIRDFAFGTNVLKPTISFIDISSYATSDKLLNSTLDFDNPNNQNTIAITAENSDFIKQYTLSLTLSPNFPSFSSYTGTDTLGATIQHSLVTNLDIIRISDLANNVDFSYTINGVKLPSPKKSNGGIITLKETDFPFNLSTVKAGEEISISLEANQQVSFTKNFVFTPESIYTWQDFQAMSNDLNLNYNIKKDIVFDGNYTFKTIGTQNAGLTGTLNGNNFEVRNLYINDASASHMGIFANISSTSSVTNLIIRNAKIIAKETSGVIAGTNEGIIENCSVIASSITGSGNKLGGLVGEQSGSRLSGSFQGNIVSPNGENIGGLAGINYTTVIGFMNGDSLTGLNNIGGLVGTNYGTVIGYARTIITGNIVGGIVGRNIPLNAGNVPSIIGFGILQISSSTTLSGGLVSQNNGSLIGYWGRSKGAVQGKASGTPTTESIDDISSVANIKYTGTTSPPNFYDDQGTPSTADDVNLMQFNTFNQYFDIELFKNQNWPKLKNSFTINSDTYTFSITQPVLR